MPRKIHPFGEPAPDRQPGLWQNSTVWETRRWRGVQVAMGCLCLLLFAGCASDQAGRVSANQSESAPRFWPPPPEQARITYVRTVRNPAEAGIRPFGLRRLAQRLIGSDKGNERLLKPFGIAVDEHDNLCLTDTGDNSVIYFDRVNGKWHRWDRIGKTRFVSPVALAKSNGMFFVADSGLGRVLVFDEKARNLFQITNKLERPTGVALAGSRLFVTDSQRHRIVSFDPGGRFLFEFGQRGTGPGQFNFPTHIAADSNGNILVTDSLNSRVQVFDQAGNFKGQLGSIGDSTGQFSRPKGVAVDSLGHVYVIDALFDNIQIFDGAGSFLLNFGEAGDGPGEFWLPNGIAANHANEIFVTDSYNHRIQIFRYVGDR